MPAIRPHAPITAAACLVTLLLLTTVPPPAYGQVFKASSTVQAEQFPGAPDTSVQMNNAARSLGSSGGIVDATEFTGVQETPWSMVPWAGITAPVIFKFGVATFITNVPITQPSDYIKVWGEGKQVTIIQAGSAISHSQDIWTLQFGTRGNPAANYNYGILRDLTIDGVNGQRNGQDGLVIDGGNEPKIENVEVLNTYRDCLAIAPSKQYHWFQNGSIWQLHTANCGRDGLLLHLQCLVPGDNCTRQQNIFINGLNIYNWQGRGVGQNSVFQAGYNIHVLVETANPGSTVANFLCAMCLLDSQTQHDIPATYIENTAQPCINPATQTHQACSTVSNLTFLNGGQESTNLSLKLTKAVFAIDHPHYVGDLATYQHENAAYPRLFDDHVCEYTTQQAIRLGGGKYQICAELNYPSGFTHRDLMKQKNSRTLKNGTILWCSDCTSTCRAGGSGNFCAYEQDRLHPF